MTDRRGPDGRDGDGPSDGDRRDGDGHPAHWEAGDGRRPRPGRSERDDRRPAGGRSHDGRDGAREIEPGEGQPDRRERGPAPREDVGGNGASRTPQRRGWLLHLYDVATSAGAVLLVGLLIVAVSGVWPPLVAIESGSMEPNIHAGDLVFVMDSDRFPGPGAHENTGIVPAREGAESGYGSFEGPGDVIVFQPGGNSNATPVIHRAMFWVEAGENWYDRADGRHVGVADSCSDLVYCEAPHAGFITRGDANTVYDQVGSDAGSAPVKPEWILGTAEYRVPYLGWLRLEARSAVGGGTAAETGGSLRGVNVTTGPAAAAP